VADDTPGRIGKHYAVTGGVSVNFQHLARLGPYDNVLYQTLMQ